MKRLIENKNVRFRTQFNSNLFSEQLQLTRVIFGGNFLSARISFETSWIELENPWLKVFLSKKAVQMTYAYDMVKSTGLRKLVEEAIQQAGKDEYRVFFIEKKGFPTALPKVQFRYSEKGWSCLRNYTSQTGVEYWKLKVMKLISKWQKVRKLSFLKRPKRVSSSDPIY